MCDEASFHLGCVCFGWKWFQEIIFTLFRMFGCNGKYNFPEIVFLLTRIYAFDSEMNLRSHFHFNSFPEREREREREKREPRSEREWEKRELRSESTDRRSRCSSDDRTAPMSGAIDERNRWDRAGFGLMRSHRSSSLVVRTIASLRSELSLLSRSVIHFLLLGFGFFCLIWCIFCKNIWMNQP